MKKDKFQKNIMFLDALSEVLGRCDDQTSDEAIEKLKNLGIATDSQIKRLKKYVQETYMGEQLDIAQEKILSKEKSQLKVPKDYKGWSKEKILSRIKDILNADPITLSLYYKALETRTEDDLRTILEDLESEIKQNDSKENKDDE